MAKNELAVIDSKNLAPIVPDSDVIKDIMEELSDMDRFPYGKIKIATGGANVFKVIEPGCTEDESVTATEIEGVILMSHKVNGYWKQSYTGGNAAPDCSSINGADGIDSATGECHDCDSCPLNQYGSANNGEGRGKACKNMRRLYIMRRGDVFPLVLTLPPTGMGAYDRFRTKVMLNNRKKLSAVMTLIKLKSEKNADGIMYSAPVFSATGALTAEEAAALQAFADSLTASAARVGVTADDRDDAPRAAAQPTTEDFAVVTDAEAQDVDEAFQTIE